MPFCPSCGVEYNPGVEICSDCREPLKERPLSTPGSSPIRFVPMPGLPGGVYAEMIKHVLEKQGIPCYIQTEGVGGAYAIRAVNAIGSEARLYVPEDRIEECLKIQHGLLDHI